jgi:phage-related protein
MIEQASMLAPIFMAAGPIMAGFSGIMGIMTPVVSAAKLAFIGLNLSMGPIALVIIGIGLAIVAAIVIWKNWDKIILGLKKTLEVLKATFKTVFDFIKEIVSKVFAKITDIYNSKLGWLLPAGPLIKAILFLKDNWDEIWDGIQTKFKTVSDALVAIFRSVKGTILQIWDGMATGIKSAINGVIGTINGFIQRINSIRITVPGVDIPGVGRVGGFSVGMPNIPEIPTLAKGGIVTRPTLAMLGESGPEAVIPLGRGRGGAGMTINLVINGDINGFDDFEQKVTSVIRDAVLGGGFSGVLARA